MPETHSWELRFGARVVPGGVEFRVWAPLCSALGLRILHPMNREFSMNCGANGEFSIMIPDLESGADYLFVLEDHRKLPDPVSRSQPAGVHGPSRVVDPNLFAWSDADWRGIPLEQLVIYELHTATFTPGGTFDDIIPRLHYLRHLGITAIELMPVAEFPGVRNWGYDGVCLYAPHSAYGGPDGLKRLINACHQAGLAVVLDVVYNHFGPEGNYLGEFAPCFTSTYLSPWGNAINFDGAGSDGMRRFFIDNALYWLTEFHIDALRLDAIHEIFDAGARHFLADLAQSFHDQARLLGRLAFVIAESDLNDVRIIQAPADCGYGLDAQWHDDFHHALHAVLTGSHRGYLSDFGTLADLSKSIREGFVYDGKHSHYRDRRHGSSSEDLPGKQFVVFIQNHDQVANAYLGDRLARLIPIEQQKLAAAVLLCAPFIPMIFMGQEYGETAPFYFFTSYGNPDLAQAVCVGRRKEYAAFYADQEFPDPQAILTFDLSRLSWSLDDEPNAGLLRFYQDLLALRKKLASLSNCRKDLVRTALSDSSRWLVVERRDPSGARALLICNFSGTTQAIPIVFDDAVWLLALWSGAPRYGNCPTGTEPPRVLAKAPGGRLVLEAAGYGAFIYVTTRSSDAEAVGQHERSSDNASQGTAPSDVR